jgi:hypothetical protein
VRDVGGEDAVRDRGDVADDAVGFVVEGEVDVIATGYDAEMGFLGGRVRPTDEEAVEVIGRDGGSDRR